MSYTGHSESIQTPSLLSHFVSFAAFCHHHFNYFFPIYQSTLNTHNGTKSNQLNLPLVDSNQAVETSQR